MDPRFEPLLSFFEEKIPFNRLLGMVVHELRPGHCELRVAARPELVGDPFRPALHGGVVSALADTAGGLAVFSQVGPEDRVSTLDMRVDYLRPARVDQTLRALATVMRMGNRVGVVDILLVQDDETAPVARSTAVYNVVRRSDVG